jgi:DNA modification methylase
MKPYYQDESVTIYHGDCRDIVPQLGKFDLLLTDPPYGIDAAANKRGGKQHGKAAVPSRDYGTSDWDKTPPSRAVLDMLRDAAKWSIIWGGNYFEGLPPRRGWLVWDKDNGNNGYADCELAWTNLELAVRKFRFRWMGMLQENMGEKEPRLHPTQKPTPLMTWCIDLTTNVHTILDPFMGVGTTLVAAKQLGIKAVGIEREERYCADAVTRLAQDYLPFTTPIVKSAIKQHDLL